MQTFGKEGFVILRDFFTKEEYKELRNKIAELDFKKDVNIVHHSYSQAEFSFKDDFFGNLKCKTYLFTWKDYQILHDKFVEEPGIDVIIDLTDHWNAQWGGVVTYVDGSGDYTEILPLANSVAIVKRKKGMNRFVRYVNHYAKGKRILLVCKFKENLKLI